MSLSAAPTRMLARLGRPMTLRRRIGTSTTNFNDHQVRGYLTAFRPNELVGGVREGDASLTIGPDAGQLGSPRSGDFVQIDGRQWSVLGATSLHVGSTLAGHRLWVRGS